MDPDPLAQAACLIEQAFALIDSSSDPMSALLVIEGVKRRADRATVAQIAAVDHDGAFSERGYRTTVGGLKDLLGWDHAVAQRHVTVARDVGPSPVLPATADAFASGAATMRHVEVIGSVLTSGLADDQ